ncbi:MAG: TetR/AcrR family transcriptional regulator, partial [Pseudonocardiales bacterium]
MTVARRAPSARQEELLERAYDYVLAHGLAELSLRPLAAAIESSPRVLLFLFGSKHGLVRALLARARSDELALIDQTRHIGRHDDLATVLRTTWLWLAADAHRPLLNLWAQAYARSLVEPGGPWAHFAEQSVADWLAVLAAAQPAARRNTKLGAAERTLALSVLRGALLDLLAAGEAERTTAAVDQHLTNLLQS